LQKEITEGGKRAISKNKTAETTVVAGTEKKTLLYIVSKREMVT